MRLLQLYYYEKNPLKEVRILNNDEMIKIGGLGLHRYLKGESPFTYKKTLFFQYEIDSNLIIKINGLLNNESMRLLSPKAINIYKHE